MPIRYTSLATRQSALRCGYKEWAGPFELPSEEPLFRKMSAEARAKNLDVCVVEYQRKGLHRGLLLKRAATLAAALLLASCAIKPPAPEPEFAMKYRNACLPEAIAMSQGLRDRGIKTRVLRIETPKWGHAICSYLYPPGSNTLWGWDSYWKSNRLRAWADNPDSIAREWLRVTMSDQPLTSAQFLD